MEQLGYVARRKLPGNNKLIRVFLTPKGAALRTQSVAAAEEVNRIALAGASRDDVAAARRVLIAIVDNLEGERRPARRRGQAPRRRQSAKGLPRAISRSVARR
jgi:hypothetical protein